MLRGKLAPFFQEPGFRVQGTLKNDTRKQPGTIIKTENEIVIAVILAKAGYFNGNPCIVLNAPVDIVLNTYHYEMFTREYERTFYELNKE